MRLKLLSPGEMDAEQKQTYDEAIAGKRGAPPAPMMAWLNSPDMARHATRLGEQLRFNTIFPAKLSEIAILVTARHWTAHYEWYAHNRLALWLENWLAKNHPDAGDKDVLIVLPYTQSEVAAQIGTVREVVSRGFSRMEKEGILKASGKRVTVLSRAKLREMANQ